MSWLAALSPRKRRRARIVSEPFPPQWDAIIDANVAAAARLPAPHRARLRELVQIFVAEKHWEGCGGLELTDEMKVTIAAQASLMVVGRDDELYRDVASIVVYPTTVITPPRRLATFEQPRSPIAHGGALIGEAMLGGPVVLAWDAAIAGTRGELPGNVVVHEFAHKLDMATGTINGTPPLPDRAAREQWARVFSQAYFQHRAAVDHGVPTLLDPYGATNEAEFFAVASETYFTHPYALAYEHPEVFVALRDFYRVDLR